MRVEQLLYRAGQVRELDRQAAIALELDSYGLMQRAGEAAFAWLQKLYPAAGRLLILCGSGNNGGDAYVVARLAMAANLQVTVCGLGREPAPESAAGQAKADFLQASGETRDFSAALIDQADLLIDGLLGTGLDRPVEGGYANVIESVNNATTPVMALDIPSGLSADTGSVLGCAIGAESTITFIALKLGLYTGDACDHTGIIEFARLNVPDSVYQHTSPAATLLGADTLAAWLPRRRFNTHKGNYGHLLAIGGAPGMAGAIRLTGEAALRAGAGLVTLATHPDHAPFVNQSRPELMVQGINAGDELVPILSKATVVAPVMALGPGLGTGDWGRALWQAAIASDKPLVLDADGLNLLAQNPQTRDNWILTPHPGEAARLLNVATADIQRDRIKAAQQLATTFQAVVILKGSGTVIASPDSAQSTAICPYGNPGMATAGMGDVLTGVVAALAAQGLDLFTAARAGVLAHALAGDMAAGQQSRGLLASDLILHLRTVLNP